MNRNDIIRMAREAGLDIDTAWGVPNVTVMRFAALVAEKEREECAKVCDEDLKKWKGQADVERVAEAIRARSQP